MEQDRIEQALADCDRLALRGYHSVAWRVWRDETRHLCGVACDAARRGACYAEARAFTWFVGSIELRLRFLARDLPPRIITTWTPEIAAWGFAKTISVGSGNAAALYRHAEKIARAAQLEAEASARSGRFQLLAPPFDEIEEQYGRAATNTQWRL